MKENSRNKKRTALLILMLVLSLMIYMLSADNRLFATAAQVVGACSLILYCLWEGRARVFLSAALIVLMTAAGLFIANDPIDALLFTLSFALPGLCIGISIKRGRDFAEYMILGAALLLLVSILSVIHDLDLAGLPRTVDAAVDYLMEPSMDMLSRYTAMPGVQSNVTLETLASVMRQTAIGSFVAAVFLEIFFAYTLAGALNYALDFRRPGFFESLKLFNISRVGGIIFIICSIVNIWTAGENPNIFASNLYTILEYPLALGGAATIYRFLSMYGAKKQTKRTVTAIVCILTVLPVLNIAAIVSYIGALNAIIPFTMPKEGPPEKK
jgi:hypothetical protein